MRRRPLLLAGAALIALAARAVSADGAQASGPAPATVDDARAALDRALAWLVETQRPDGSWGTAVLEGVTELGFSVESFYSWKVAADALACLALLEAPETPARRQALERGLDWLTTTRAVKRGSDWDVDHVWGALYGLVACVRAAGDPRFADGPRAEAVARRGQEQLAILLASQTPAGGWAYYDDRVYSRRPTWDTSFCTALVLPALDRAGELGWLADDGVLARGRAYVRRCALPSGAYAYDLRMLPRAGLEGIDDVKGSLGRIQVCNWALARTGDRRITAERVREGLEAFVRDHRFLDVARMRPIPHEAYYKNSGYFYLFGHYYAAEAVGLLPAPERPEWFARLRPHLLKVQRKDGSTSDYLISSYSVVAGTSYLALALALDVRASD